MPTEQLCICVCAVYKIEEHELAILHKIISKNNDRYTSILKYCSDNVINIKRYVICHIMSCTDAPLTTVMLV